MAFSIMGRRVNLWLIVKIYAYFGLANVIFKVLSILRHFIRTKRLWKHLPGKHADIIPIKFMKNTKRIPDYIMDIVYTSTDQTADLVNFPYVEPAVYCNTPESVKWMLKDEFDSITKGKASDPIFQLMTKFLGEDGIFVLRHGDVYPHDHNVWEKERKTSALIFTKNNMEKVFLTTFEEKCCQLLNRLDGELGRVVDLQELFFSFTMDSIEKFFMGNEVNSVENGMSTYAKNFDKAHYHMMSFIFNNLHVEALCRTVLPYPFGSLSAFGKSIDTLFLKLVGFYNSDLRSFNSAISDLHEEIESYIDSTKKDPGLEDRYDIISQFLKRDSRIPKERLRDIVLNLTIAGRDTTACALSWLFFELTQNLDVQQKTFEEIQEKLGNRAPTLADLTPENLPYLNGVVYEALRLHPPVPINMKKVSKDIYYKDGTFIPKGTNLGYSAYCLGRNPCKYKNVNKFDPHRWIPFKKPTLYEFPVFQAGPRFCIGKDMAQVEIKYVTIKLLQEFSFEMSPEEAAKISYSNLLTSSVVNDKEKSSSKLLLTPRRREL